MWLAWFLLMFLIFAAIQTRCFSLKFLWVCHPTVKSCSKSSVRTHRRRQMPSQYQTSVCDELGCRSVGTKKHPLPQPGCIPLIHLPAPWPLSPWGQQHRCETLHVTHPNCRYRGRVFSIITWHRCQHHCRCSEAGHHRAPLQGPSR